MALRPSTPQLSRRLDNYRIGAVASAFSILVGLTMTNLPWEFGAPAFTHIYPWIHWLGGAFLFWGVLLGICALYPSWPRAAGWMARAGLLLTLSIYWWNVAVLSGGPTGTIVYPLMAAGLVLESTRRFRRHNLLGAFVASVGLMFGLGMLVVPLAFIQGIFGGLAHILPLVGVLLAGSAMLLGWGQWRAKRAAVTLGALMLALLFLYASWGAYTARSWIGCQLYGILALSAASQAFSLPLVRPSSLRFRLLRVLIVACVLPILVLGTVASLIAQRAVKEQVGLNAQQAAWTESQALFTRVRALEATLRVYSEDPVLRRWISTRDEAALRERLTRIAEMTPGIDRIFALDSEGNSLSGGPGPHVKGNFAEREYFREALSQSGMYISTPFIGALGNPAVVLAIRVEEDNEVVGILCGTLLLSSINNESTVASRSYDVHVVDVRNGGVVRKAGAAPSLEKSDISETILNGPDDSTERFSPMGRLLLVSLSTVPRTPWKAVVAAPLKDAYAPLARLSLAVIGMALLAAVVALGLARFGARELLAGLERLRSAFSNITNPVPADRGEPPDELQQIESVFRKMAEDIERKQQDLQAAVAAREEFLSIASHELRTPLTALSMTVDSMRLHTGSTPAAERAVTRMKKQVARLTRLISDLLDVSRLQSGRFALELAPVQGLELVKDVIERLRSVHTSHAERLTLELPEGKVEALWDEQRIEQLLTNLIENAFRYSPDASPVQVKVLQLESRLRISVYDQGIGIPPESLSKLFKSFYRAPNASSAHAGGLGLGLLICREIVERHGGTISVESEGPGLGSAFHVELPIGAGANTAVHSDASAPNARTA